MEKSKQIQAMARDMCIYGEKCDKKSCKECELAHEVEYFYAKRLYKAGYRKQSENSINPPCKVGDTVYSIKTTYSKCCLGCYYDAVYCEGCECECDSHVTREVQEERVLSIAFNGESWSVMTNASHSNYKSIGLPNQYSVFLTKEDAENLIAQMEGGSKK